MMLLWSLLAVLAPAGATASPPNPLAGVAPDSVASVLVRTLFFNFHSVDAQECTINGDPARSFASALASASPRPSQNESIGADNVMFIRLNGGRNVQVIGDAGAIYRQPHQVVFAIDGRNYAVDRASLRAMRAAMNHCDHPPQR